MGANLLLTCAVIDTDKPPDWEAAGLRINAMTAEQFQDNTLLLDQFDPDLVTYHADPGSDGEQGERLNTEPLRDRLRADVREFREAIEGERTDIDYLLVRDAKVWVTGGMSWGDQPSELCSPVHRLHLAGVLAAAGFDGGPDGTAAAENAGCDRCGTNDRTPGSRYCRACVDDGYRVFVNGRPETEYLHDTAADARDESFLVAEQTQDGIADVHGPGDYRERVELAEHTGGTR
jgi:hypothetical protein